MVVLVVSGWIIIADLISGEQTGLNFDKTLLHFVSLDSSSLGSAFGWIILGDLICGNQTGSNFGKTVPSLDSTRGLRLSGDQTGSRRQKIILPFTLWDKWDICGRKLRHVFRTQSVLYFSSVIVNQNMSNGSFKKWKWFPEDLPIHEFAHRALWSMLYCVYFPGTEIFVLVWYLVDKFIAHKWGDEKRKNSLNLLFKFHSFVLLSKINSSTNKTKENHLCANLQRFVRVESASRL